MTVAVPVGVALAGRHLANAQPLGVEPDEVAVASHELQRGAGVPGADQCSGLVQQT